MDRRSFLNFSGIMAGSLALKSGLSPWLNSQRLYAAEIHEQEPNPNFADLKLGATATASSNDQGYRPLNVLKGFLQSSWQTEKETAGSWLEIAFAQEQMVSELLILPRPLPYDIVLDPDMRGGKMATARKVTCTLSGGGTVRAELRQSKDFEIVVFPQAQKAKSVRITIDEIWPEPNSQGTGLGSIRVFGRPHAASFEVFVYTMYDAQAGKPVQSATIEVANPGAQVEGGVLQVLQAGRLLATIPLGVFAARSVSRHDIWIPAPYEDEVMEFRIADQTHAFKDGRNLQVSAYHSYFDGGTFDILDTNHNDLGWLDTQKITADFRSKELILPAMDLIRENPEFRYSMECVAYLREFLDRHPERREEMAQLMRARKFVWGASYVENLEVHVGPENLVRQFYLGRRWLHKNFTGVDSVFYCKTDPPCMTQQMPQILAKAGIKYAIQGRFPWGFYNWEAPDGSSVFVFAFRYASAHGLPDPKGNEGWLSSAAEREDYYRSRELPPQMIYDYNSDYLPPTGSLIPYVHDQNAAMKRFADVWNQHYKGQPGRQIKPPVLRLVEAQGALDDFTSHEPNVQTVNGDWPFAWAYYDEPGHREGLLAGRLAHNRILMAERLTAGLLQAGVSTKYPAATFEEAWQANCWPDHGWGGNRGTVSDGVYVESYEKSKMLADKLLADAGEHLAGAVTSPSSDQLAVVVYNPLSWQRTDIVRCTISVPAGWSGVGLRDSAGRETHCQIVNDDLGSGRMEIAFLAESVPSTGYKTYRLERADSSFSRATSITADIMENDSLRIVLGAGGLKSLFDKRMQREMLKTDKFFGGEILQFTAPGIAWEETVPVTVTSEDFDKTSNHDFHSRSFDKGPVMTTTVREAQFRHFKLRQTFRLYASLDRVEMDVDILDWDGPQSRELRMALPIDLPQDCQLSYEVPFGTVEMGKGEIEFADLPAAVDCEFGAEKYGGNKPLPFREAINWIDASSNHYLGGGCLAASDCTLHLFADQTDNPVNYPVLQHVLLSTRKCLGWNPQYWFTQEGSHRFRMALYPHSGGWRNRYRDGVAFNYPLIAFSTSAVPGGLLPADGEFLHIEPRNMIMTALKKSEDDDSITLRFFEAEGSANGRARVRLFRPIKQAWKTNLIEEEDQPVAVNSDGTVELAVKPWEIMTLRLRV
jgi:alpha-mannosidase